MTEEETTEATRLGAAIKARRYDRGLTTTALAEALGISDRHLRYIEAGEKLPSAPLYRKIAEQLDATLPAITGDDDDREAVKAASR